MYGRLFLLVLRCVTGTGKLLLLYSRAIKADNLENPICISVQSLKTIRFSSLILEEKQNIKSVGRPKPNLSITHVTKCKTRDYKRTFKIATYEKAAWLCGCDISNSLYCFPCLLFAGDVQTEWTRSGVKDLIHLKEKIKKHQSSKRHLSDKIGFNLLVNKIFDNN